MGIVINNRGSALTFVVILLVFVLLLGGGGYYYYSQHLVEKKFGDDFKTDLVHIPLKEDLLRFSYKQVPETYKAMVALNSEIIIVDKEIERLILMEKEFPGQVKIVATEKKIWQNNKQNIIKVLTTLNKEIEAMYVTFKVNKDKGLELVRIKKDVLQKNASEMLRLSFTQTKRLKIPPEPSKIQLIISKIKEKIQS